MIATSRRGDRPVAVGPTFVVASSDKGGAEEEEEEEAASVCLPACLPSFLPSFLRSPIIRSSFLIHIARGCQLEKAQKIFTGIDDGTRLSRAGAAGSD